MTDNAAADERVFDFVTRFIEREALARMVVAVMRTMPAAVVGELLDDPGFHLAEEDYVPGRGVNVFMACPAPESNGSRSVVLRRRLLELSDEAAHYVIAHELAHAHLWNGGWGDIDDREQAADALALSWGFPRPY